MKAKTPALPFLGSDSAEEMTEKEFISKSNAMLREFDAIIARTRKTSERIARLQKRSRELREAFRRERRLPPAPVTKPSRKPSRRKAKAS